MLPPGQWRGVLKLTDPDQVIASGVIEDEQKVLDYFELPFNLEVEYSGDQMEVFLLNGAEKIKIESVHYGRDPATAKDTLKFDFLSFDTSMDGFYEENFIEGYWIVNYKEKYKIPFIAHYGFNHRFIDKPMPDTKDFSGKWKVTFEYDNDEAYPAIAEFQQDGFVLNGTFLTETGDYRFLSGNAFGDKMRLSVFDGSHAFLFSGSLQQDTIYGEFRSGKHYKSKWQAVRDEGFSLEDPYAMTKSTSAEAIDFSFQDEEGLQISLSDSKYKGKTKLINIMGTWCPNCKDEIIFLKEIKETLGDDIELVTIAFERYRDEAKAKSILKKYKSALDFDWPILLGGYASKKETGETFAFLDKIYSYPTLLIVDAEDKIRYIHTGFSGPATSKYSDFKKDFDLKLNELLTE